MKKENLIKQLPKTAGTCADKAYALMMENRELNKKIELNKKMIAELNRHGMTLLKKGKLTEAAGKTGRLEIKEKWTFVYDDKELFVTYALDHGERDLLDIRMSAKALEQRAEVGVKVPGIKSDKIDVPNLRKA